MAAKEAQTYKIKRIDFLNRRNVPIVLQNENGPCPLIAISNVLLLRNNINIHPDLSEIHLQDLLALVADRLLNTNLTSQGKDEAYIQNQQQNVSDAIAMLPRLATGIDVNVRFRSIHDFEFTPETAIFDLLDISLVHGWLVDPQDDVTLKAIGSRSYNSLVEKLVELQEAHPDLAAKLLSPADSSTPEPHTATPPPPSPEAAAAALSAAAAISGSGGIEEVDDVQRADAPAAPSGHNEDVDLLATGPGPLGNDDEDDDDDDDEQPSLAAIGRAESSLTLNEATEDALNRALKAAQLEEGNDGDAELQRAMALSMDNKIVFVKSMAGEEKPESPSSGWMSVSTLQSEEVIPTTLGADAFKAGFLDDEPDDADLDDDVESAVLKPGDIVDVQPSLRIWLSEDDTVADCLKAAELHMGTVEEEPSRTAIAEGTHPVPHKDEVGQPAVERMDTEKGKMGEEELSEALKEGLLVYNFLSSTASQLTYHGLFCLQDGIKERELCVFFRNNHFNSIFKYEGALYMLATDQGYLNQPNLVWEKLSQVEGDNQFATGDFHIFHVESVPKSWAEEDEAAIALAATRDLEEGKGAGELDYTSDLQLAMALQQQEIDEQNRRQAQAQGTSSVRPPNANVADPANRGLVVGPNRPVAGTQEEKDKRKGDNCAVM